jgi:outer membrane receptor for ferrienterochelin and colicin
MRLRLLVRKLAFVAVGTLAFASTAAAQGVTTSALGGSVLDQAGQPLAGAQVTVTNAEMGTSSASITNEAGRYFVANLVPGGPYTVEVSLIGYRPEQRTGVMLTLGRTEGASFMLTETAVELDALVVVAESNPLLSPTRTGTSTTIEAAEIQNQPTVSRDITNFALLDSRVQVTSGGPSIAGQNNRYNNIQIDGAVNNDVFGLADSGIPGGQVGAKSVSLEVVKEFQVLTAPYDVRYSGFSGGLLNAITKSGTNTTHGSVFGYYTNEGFQSSLTVNDEEIEKSEFNNAQFGFTLGGPIVKDKIHYFVGGEFQRFDGPTSGLGVDPGGSATQPGATARGIAPDSAQRFIDIMGDVYGVPAADVGTSATVTLDNPRTNLFARLDFQLSDNHRLVIRDNYAKNRADRGPFRASFFYGYTSQNQDFTNTTNTLVAQLFSTFGGVWNNELLFNWGLVRDLRDPVVPYAQIAVDNDSGDLGSNTLVIGAEEFSQANSLDQDFLQLTDNLSRAWGNHRATFGLNVEWFKFDNLFFPASIGIYEYDSLADLENGVIGAYEVNTLAPGVTDPAAKFSVTQPGFYIQDEWAINQNWNLQFGLRMDVPIMNDSPLANPAFEQAFGVSTTETPSGNILWQPRFGFNWQSGAQQMTQVRGGAGMFSGRPPYVWLSNIYTNTGGQQVKLFCDGDNAPAFDRGNYPGNIPQQCLDGTTAAEAGTPVVNVFDPDAKFPVEAKFNLAVDQVLPKGFVITGEVLYTKAVQQFFFEDINIPSEQIGVDPTQGDRPLFGTPTAGLRDGAYAPQRVSDDFAQVIRVTNKNDNRALLLTFELSRQMNEWLGLRAGYTYSDVDDTQGLFSSQATSNYGRNAIRGNPNDPELTNSSFERPHRLVLSATFLADLGRNLQLEVTPQYFGQSGNPYSFVVRGDVNGDGYRGQGISRDNDLLYIPNNANEYVWQDAGDAADFQRLIDDNECLSSQAGSIMKRNSCRNPWTNRFDLRGVLRFGSLGPGGIDLVFDWFNVFRNKVYRTADIDRGEIAVRYRGREGDVDDGRMIFSYEGSTADNDGDGKIDPYTVFDGASRSSFQLGLRYTF